MQLTKEQLIDAHEQGLNVQTKGGTNFKIVAHLIDVFAVQYNNSTKISWYGIDKINELQCSIESKIEIDFSILNKDNIYVFKTKLHTYISKYRSQKKEYIELNSNCLLKNNLIDPFIRGLETCVITEISTPTESELELFYSKFPDLKPKKYIQGFEVKDGYNEIVTCSNDNVNFRIDILKIVYSDNCQFPFTCVNGSYRYARYPRKEEINEIKFSN